MLILDAVSGLLQISDCVQTRRDETLHTEISIYPTAHLLNKTILPLFEQAR